MSPTDPFPARTLLADVDGRYIGMSMGSGQPVPASPDVDHTLYNPAVRTKDGGLRLAPTNSLQVFTRELAAAALRSTRGDAVHVGDLVVADEQLGYIQEVIPHGGVSVTLVFANDVSSWEIPTGDYVLAYCPDGHC